MNELMTEVFVEQPLASPGSAKHCWIEQGIMLPEHEQALAFPALFGDWCLLTVSPESLNLNFVW